MKYLMCCNSQNVLNHRNQLALKLNGFFSPSEAESRNLLAFQVCAFFCLLDDNLL